METVEIVSKSARKEIVEALRKRYGKATKSEKVLILGEFTAVTGFHRKHAIRILKWPAKETVKEALESTTGNQRIYGEAVKAALIILWESADRICGKRLMAAIPTLIDSMERHGHLKLDPAVRKLVLAVSAATIDRMMTPVRKGAGMRRQRRRVKKLSKEIPVKTFADWKDPSKGSNHSLAYFSACGCNRFGAGL